MLLRQDTTRKSTQVPLLSTASSFCSRRLTRTFASFLNFYGVRQFFRIFVTLLILLTPKCSGPCAAIIFSKVLNDFRIQVAAPGTLARMLPIDRRQNDG